MPEESGERAGSDRPAPRPKEFDLSQGGGANGGSKDGSPSPLNSLLAAIAAREAIYRESVKLSEIHSASAAASLVPAPARPQLEVGESPGPGTQIGSTADLEDTDAERKRLTALVKKLEGEVQALRAQLTERVDPGAPLPDASSELGALREERDKLAAQTQKLEEELRLLRVQAPAAEPAPCAGCVERDERLAEVGKELNAVREQLEREAEAARSACAEREERIKKLEAELEQARQAAPAPAPANGDLKQLQEKYKALQTAKERERQEFIKEIAAMNERLSQARRQNERLSMELEKLQAASSHGTPPLAAAPTAQQNKKSATIDLDGEPPPRPPGMTAYGSRALPTKIPEPGPDLPEIVVVDDCEVGQETTAKLQTAGLFIQRFSEEKPLDAQFPMPTVACAALNLALPSTWRLMRAVRAHEPTKRLPFVGYALPPRSEGGFWFGRIDTVLLPDGIPDLVENLRLMGTGLKQVVAIGADKSVLEEVARQMARDRVNVHMALNRPQALDTVRRVYPQIAVVHPTPNPVDAFRAIAGIRGISAFLELPFVFLLDAMAQPREEEKLSAGVRTILRLGDLSPRELLERLPKALNGIRPAPRTLKRI